MANVPANVPPKTLSWLWAVVGRDYRDPRRTYSDLAHTLSRYPSLTPRTDVYTFENGTHALLVRLVGTVPVAFRGTVYRFPIALWIPHAYPYEAPMVYVTPTDDMVVRQGQHVAGDGRIYHHYLAHWPEAWDRSHVADLLTILSGIFANEPPVMAKSRTAQPPQQQYQQQQPPQQQYQQQQPPQQKFQQQQPPQQQYQQQQQQQQQQPPPRPPLPYDAAQRSSSGTPTQQPGAPPRAPPKQPSAQEEQQPNPAQDRPGRYEAPLPLPQQPQSSVRPPSMYSEHPQSNGTAQYATPPSQNMPQRVSSLRQQPQQIQPQVLAPQAQGPPFSQHQNLPRQVQQHPPSHHYVQPQAHPGQQTPLNQPQRAPQPSLLDSPFDIPLSVAQQNLPAPPIPRNPEKDALLSHLSTVLTNSLHSQIQQNSAAIPPLQSQNAALQSTIPRLQAELASLSALQDTLKSNISLLQESLSHADQTISSARQRAAAGDIPKVDDMLVPPHVVGKQLYDTVTEERGVETAIFALHDAFVRGRVSSDVWSRKTRELAREGFKKRYLSRKIGVGMGLEAA